MITIKPNVITAYPLDVISLTANANNTPPLWVISGYERLNTDYSLTVDNTHFENYRGALQLFSGSGSVQWTLTERCLPGASDSIGFLIGVDGSGSNILEVRFNNAQYKIVDSTGTVQTTSYVAAAGDIIKLELFGATLRAYLNGSLIYTKNYTSTNPYPARFLAYTYAALATSPTTYQIPAPELSGDWRCTKDYVRWNVPSTLGTYTTTDDERTAQITVSGNPGAYTVTGIIGAAGDLDTSLTNTGADTVFVLNPALAVNDLIQFGTTPGDTLPGGLSADTNYYVKSYSSGNTQVSLTQGGAAVNITSAGTGGWVARVGEVALQNGTATVVIPAFDVVGIPENGIVEIEAGETVTFRTTYDSAQYARNGSYITRTVVTGGGGSFDANTGAYTAPSTAGDYTIRLESNNQRRNFTVRVPVYLTPRSEYVYPGEARTNTTNMSGSLSWSATGSVSLSGSGTSRTWTAPSNVGQVVRISVTNGTLTEFRDYEVLDVLPVPISINVPHSAGPDTLIAYPDSGRNPWMRTKTEVGFVPQSFDCTAVVEVDDYETLEAFHDQQMRSGAAFFFTEHYRSDRRTAVRFDSLLEAETLGCLIQVKFKLKKA